jgi:hypothetical protein
MTGVKTSASQISALVNKQGAPHHGELPWIYRSVRNDSAGQYHFK